MKTIKLENLELQPELYEEIERVLKSEGVVCLPCNSSYRIVADLKSETAVNRLLQSKHRTRKAPSMVFIDGEPMLDAIASNIDPVARKLARKVWPRPLTILFDAHDDLPPKVVKQLSKANGKIGVRVPSSPVVKKIISRLGGPLLVSSANREQKQGAGSPAQIRKNFANRIDIFIDAGDLSPNGESSTVVDVEKGAVTVTRAGAVSADEIAGIAK